MGNIYSKKGMTMAEMLIVVAIIIVLMSVAFIAIFNHQRNLAQLERDGIAKELFIAAQNHLSLAKGEGYLGTHIFGTEGTVSGDTENGVYYYSVDEGTVSDGGNSMFEQMLPFGSVDETIRAGGSYIIRYQPKQGKVMDVFYCSANGTPKKFNKHLNTSEYGDMVGLRGNNKKEQRKNLNGAVVGWYGDEKLNELDELELNGTPKIKIRNAERLSVEIYDPNYEKYADGALLQLIVEGKSSGAKKAILLNPASKVGNSRVDLDIPTHTYTVVLDDITASSGDNRFGKLPADNGKTFAWGENIKVYAVSYSNTKLTKILYSIEMTTNSLFGELKEHIDDFGITVNDTAQIGNIRHLENLGNNISVKGNYIVNANDKEPKLNITKAKQTSDLSWREFQYAIAGKDDSYSSLSDIEKEALQERANKVRVIGVGSGFCPINPGYALDYDGKNYRISDVMVKYSGDAGLFGSSSQNNKIQNVELIDFDISGENAGSLAGSFTNTTIKNVIARETSPGGRKITATLNGGGLVGNMGGGEIGYSAAAVVVTGNITGGLVGSANGTISNSFSGGHTKDGMYDLWIKENGYDVSGNTVGGLVGNANNTTIKSCYSTCSVSGDTVGGLVGNSDGTIENCYATGYVVGKLKEFAFLGNGSAELSDNYYYEGVNRPENVPLPPVEGYNTKDTAKIKPIDLDTDTYDDFVGDFKDWGEAVSYDSKLVEYYHGKYLFRTINELDKKAPDGYSNWLGCDYLIKKHYGDFPSDEIFLINE